MHPIERLRYVARAGDPDPALLASDAAGALAGLSADPRALLVAARRLLEFHPGCAPLWSVAARVLAAGDARAESDRCIEELGDDPTAEELAVAFDGSAVVATVPSPVIVASCELRPDLALRLIADGWTLRSAARTLSDHRDLACYLPDELEEAIADATVAVVEIAAAGASGVVVDITTRSLVAGAGRLAIPVWAVAPIGRVLPEPLFRAFVARNDAYVSHYDEFDRVVGPDGPETPAVAFARSDCPALAELTH